MSRRRSPRGASGALRPDSMIGPASGGAPPLPDFEDGRPDFENGRRDSGGGRPAGPAHGVPRQPVPETGSPEPAPDGAPPVQGGSALDGALAFVESPVQLLNVLEWAHNHPAPSTATPLTLVVLPPTDPMTRGQLRRMAELARDEGVTVRWQEARDGMVGVLGGLLSLSRRLRRAGTLVIGDPFSRYVQLLLALTPARAERRITVVDDGTATMEFVSQLARGERFVRWHRRGARGGARGLLFAPVSRRARRRLTPRPDGSRPMEVFSSMPVEAPENVTVTANEFAWTRARFGPPRLTKGADLVGTSLVETGVVDTERYLEAVASLARAYGATRYFAHRRESSEKLQQVSAATGLEIVRPDLPLELVARRGPVGRTILSFPSTVVHTLPLALAGTAVTVAVCDVDPAWLTHTASPRAEGFLAGVTGSARGVRRLPSALPSTPGREAQA
ncbi:hypothetical protein [Streptomyces sp. NBC_01187]|uniref:hypothetical protein n=1 Tax=Streptomyces sp. NBC_01187 TaxID=2903766 RepID=UPI003869B115|nr:hypothetical protein OG220_24395 [Streptomyces sp. NBC_01187]